MSLVVGSLEREGVSVMWGCEPREVRRRGGEEGGPLEVSWYKKSSGESHGVNTTLIFRVQLNFVCVCCVLTGRVGYCSICYRCVRILTLCIYILDIIHY